MAPGNISYYDYTDQTGDGWFLFSGSTNASSTTYVCDCSAPPTRRIIITLPEAWAEDDALAWVRLLNQETHTGWIVEMLIRGKILITDPNIEVRSMADFLPLLRLRATPADQAKIQAFFEEHPLA